MPHPSPALSPVALINYDPDWPRFAVAYAKRLNLIGDNLVAVHHIGSTAIEGLAAKPIIDLMPIVTDLSRLDGSRQAIEAAGLEWLGELGIPGRRYCRLVDADGIRLAQFHFFEQNSPHILRHIAFRNYLRAHRDIALAYETEKRRARDMYPDNSHDYTEEKSAWIKKVEAIALDWIATR